MFESILSREELADVQERIDTICRLDLMGRTIRESIGTIAPSAPDTKTVRPPEEIPQVPGLPVAGNAFQMAGDLRAFLARNYRTYGPIFRVRAFGYRFIALVGPEANVAVARISGTHLRSHEPYRDFGVAMGAHRVMLNMDGPEHLRMRKLQVNGYSPKTIESNLDVAHDATQRLIEDWPQGRPIEVQRAMQEIVAEQIGLCCTSVSPSGYIDDLTHYLATIVSVHVTKRWPKAVERLPRFRRAKRRLDELYAQILEAHEPERRAGKQPDFVDDLLEMNRTDPQLLPGNGPACKHPRALSGWHRYVRKRVRIHALRTPETSGPAGTDEGGGRRHVRARTANAGRFAQAGRDPAHRPWRLCVCIRSYRR